MDKILIVNPFGIGDVIFSTPLIEILKENFPASFIGYMCNKRASELLATNPHLSRIFVYEKDDYRCIWKQSRIKCLNRVWSFLNAIRKERFDTSIDLSLGYQYSMFLKFIGVKKRVGFNYRNRGKFLTDKIDIEAFQDKHVIEYYLDLLKPFSIDTGRYDIAPRIYTTQSSMASADTFLKEHGIKDGELVVGMIPGCGASWGMDAKYRRWGKKNFAGLAGRLIEKYNARIMLLGDVREAEICKDIQASVKHDVLNFCGKTSIKDFMNLLAKCSIVITNDGGPLHIAVGLGVKTVSVFGPVDEVIYGPYHTKDTHVVVSRKDLPCRPCYKKFKYTKCEDRKCLDLITVDEVFRASEELLKK